MPIQMREILDVCREVKCNAPWAVARDLRELGFEVSNGIPQGV